MYNDLGGLGMGLDKSNGLEKFRQDNYEQRVFNERERHLVGIKCLLVGF